MSLSHRRTFSAASTPHKKIDSAGTGALVDHSADESAIKIAELHGLSLDGHKGKQFTSSLSRRYDLILVMEKHILSRLVI